MFLLYWFVLGKGLRLQNVLVLVGSYFFYGLWDWRFLFLIIASTVVDYFVGIMIHRNEGDRPKQKLWLWASIIFNISLLGFFKYYNFFVDSFIDLFEVMGYSIKSTWTLKIILPVGISFYTFQTMSYSMDIYYKRIKPCHDFLSFATFVAFFPQLVAGPIERASNLLHQITNKRTFNYDQIVSGLKLILWGLFKKLVIADGIAPIVDDIFLNHETYPASTLILGVTLFSFQVYGDFSGYSDIAIGTAKLFGVELMSNFKFPNFSRNVAEYWQRWHISLSTWFRHYVYIPLGGSRVSQGRAIRNICIIFLVSGFWHGANWTFVVWGLINALFLIIEVATNKWRKNSFDRLHVPLKLRALLGWATSFTLMMVSLIFFRSASMQEAFNFIGNLFVVPNLHINVLNNYLELFLSILLIFGVQWVHFVKGNNKIYELVEGRPVWARWSMYLAYIAIIVMLGINRQESFIYFQF